MIIYVLACRRAGMLIITAPSHRTRIKCGSVTKCEQRRRACRVVAGPIITPISDEGLPPAVRERLIDGRNEELPRRLRGKKGDGRYLLPGDSAAPGVSSDLTSRATDLLIFFCLSSQIHIASLLYPLVGFIQDYLQYASDLVFFYVKGCLVYAQLLRKNASIDVLMIFPYVIFKASSLCLFSLLPFPILHEFLHLRHLFAFYFSPFVLFTRFISFLFSSSSSLHIYFL